MLNGPSQKQKGHRTMRSRFILVDHHVMHLQMSHF